MIGLVGMLYHGSQHHTEARYSYKQRNENYCTHFYHVIVSFPEAFVRESSPTNAACRHRMIIAGADNEESRNNTYRIL